MLNDPGGPIRRANVCDGCHPNNEEEPDHEAKCGAITRLRESRLISCSAAEQRLLLDTNERVSHRVWM